MVTTDAAAAGDGAKRALVAYDFRRPTKLAREHARLLEMVFETVARQWATVMSSELGNPVQVTFTSVEQRSYDDYVTGLPSPSVLAIFRATPHQGSAFLQLALDTGFNAIEFMLGGRGGEQPVRIPTEIESGLMSRVVERMLGELRYGLAAVTTLNPSLRLLEFNPQFVQEAAATDLYIVAGFTVKLADRQQAATVALPAAALSVRSADAKAPDAKERAAKAAARATMTGLVEDVPVEVRVRFVPRTMRSAGLLQLKVGDVVRLDHPTHRPLDVVSSGVVCARGVAGTNGTRAACLITASTASTLPGRASE